MRNIYEVQAVSWLNSITSTYNVCAKSPDDAKRTIKNLPELHVFLYNDSGFRVKRVNARTEGWRDNEIRRV